MINIHLDVNSNKDRFMVIIQYMKSSFTEPINIGIEFNKKNLKTLVDNLNLDGASVQIVHKLLKELELKTNDIISNLLIYGEYTDLVNFKYNLKNHIQNFIK